MHRAEGDIDEYFSDLGNGQRITSLEIFRARVGFEVTEGQSFSKIVEHFWQASCAASMISSINRFSGQRDTKDANKFISKKLSTLTDRFLLSDVTTEDLERIMAMHVRLQTVPTSRLMIGWLTKSVSRMNDLTDDWFKENFDHFTKLGVYPQDEFINAWWKNTRDRIHTFSPVDQYRILYKMAQFDFLRTQDFGDMYADIPSPCREVAEYIFAVIEPQTHILFPQHINNQVFFAGLWFGKDFVQGILIAGDDTSQASILEGKVAESIRKTGGIHVDPTGIIVPVTGHKIDLRLMHKQIEYGCEVDGISHFNRMSGATPTENAVLYNTSTRFHSWLSAQYLTGINILRVPYFLFDEKANSLPWEKTLSAINRKEGNSIYAWHGASIKRDLRAEKNAHLFRGHDL